MAFARFERGADEAPMSDINMTPLIDVMLVLLVIFIITAPLLAGHIALDLPKVQAPPGQQPPHALSVSVQRGGQIYLDARPTTMEALRTVFATAGRSAPDTELRIRADAAAPYGDIAAVLGAAQTAGLTHIGLVTQPATAASAAR